MSDGRRLSELVGIDRAPKNKDAGWPINLALGCLGAAVIWIAFRFLKTDDARPLYNPWLYAIVTPLVLVSLSLLLRRVVSRVVERSAQVAFLLSVMVHLILLVCAIDVVIYTRMWPAFFESLAAEKRELLQRQRTPAQYLHLAANAHSAAKRPDYLRYVPTEHEATETELSDETRLQLAQSEKADVTSPDPKPEEQSQAFLLERQQAAEVMSSALDIPHVLSRNELRAPDTMRTTADAIELQTSQTPVPELAAAEASAASRSRSGSTDLAPEASIPIEPSAFGPSAPPLGQPQAPVRTPEQPELAAAAVELHERADYSGSSQAPRSRAIAVPETPGGPSTRAAPLDALLAEGASNTSGTRRRGTASSSIGELRAPEPAILSGSTAGMGSGNAARREPAGTIGIASGSPEGAGMDRGSFSLPRGELGVHAGPAGNGRVDVPDTASVGAGNQGDSGTGIAPSQQAAARRAGESGRSRSAQVPLEVDAALGLGGVLREPGNGPLIARSAPALPELELPSLEVSRFSREDAGGPLAGGVAGPVPTPAFQQRIDRLKDETGSDTGPTGPQTELAIERGLEFLAKHQRPEGSWRLQDLDKDVLIRSDTAATGLCLLAFQGAGYTHKQYKYAGANDKALKFLISHQRPNGDLYIPQDPASDQNAWLYSHGIATLALCEAYGMTQDPALRGPAQAAVNFMVNSQEPQRGGWRYRPNLGSDTSVSGWFMMALKSAQLSGLQVPQVTFDRMARFVQASQVSASQPHLFRYNPFAPDTPEQRHGLKPTHVMTSVGLLMRMYLGWQRDLPEMQAGADYLLSYPPEVGTPQVTRRDTYYWYYATQVLFHMGGERWKQWNNRLRPILLDSQVTEGPLAGSWDPYYPTPDLWSRYGGRLYVTTLNLLSLEVYYRHLPLYEATAR